MQILENNFSVNFYMVQVMNISSLYTYRNFVIALNVNRSDATRTWTSHFILYTYSTYEYYVVVLRIFTLYSPTRWYYYQTVWPEVHFRRFYSRTCIIVRDTPKMYTSYMINHPGPKNCNNSQTEWIMNVTSLFNKIP